MRRKIGKYVGDRAFYRQVLATCLPIVIQQLLLSSASYIDGVMINAYRPAFAGGVSLAYIGVNAAGRVLFVISFILMAFSTGASIFIAQFFGANDKKKIFESVRFSLYVAAGFGVIAFFGVHFLGNYVVDMLINDPAARVFGYEYLNVVKWGSVMISVNYAMAGAFRSVKKPNYVLIACALCIGVSVFLNYGMIFGNMGFPEMGAAGAALSTVIAKTVECAVLAALILFNPFFKGLFRELRVTLNLVAGYIKKSALVVFNEVLWVSSMVLYLHFFAYNNDLWYNAYSYSVNISDLFFIVFAGLSNGTAVIIGTHLGAGDIDGAKASANRMKGLGVASGIFMGMLMFLAAPLMTSIFTGSEALNSEIGSITVSILRATAVFVAVYAYNATCFFILRSGGDSLSALLLDNGPTYLISIPIAVVLGVNASSWGLSLVFIFLASHVGDLVKLAVGTYLINKGRWAVNLTKIDFISKKDE